MDRMSQTGRIPITTALGCQTYTGSLTGWRRLSELVTVPPETTGALIYAAPGGGGANTLSWALAPASVIGSGMAGLVAAGGYLSLDSYTDVANCCIMATGITQLTAQFFSGSVGRLPIIVLPGGGGGGGGGVATVGAISPLASSGGSNPVISINNAGITRAAMQAMLLANALTPGWTYLITDATSQDVQIMVTARSSNSLEPHIKMVGDTFDRITYDITSDIIQATDKLSCIIRSNGPNWYFLNDSAHKSKGVASLDALGQASVRAIYTRQDYTHVLGNDTIGDETTAMRHWTIGCSVGLTVTKISVYMPGAWASVNGIDGFALTVGNYFGITASAWSVPDQALVITSPMGALAPVFLTSKSSLWQPYVDSVTSTTIKIKFVDHNGTIATAPDATMGVMIDHRGSIRVNSTLYNQLVGSSANIWFSATLMKQIT